MTTVYPEGRKPTFALRHRMELAMESAGLSPADMAERLGVSKVTVWGWLHQRSRPRVPTLMAWALQTGVDYDWLVGDEDPKSGRDQAGTDTPGYTLAGVGV